MNPSLEDFSLPPFLGRPSLLSLYHRSTRYPIFLFPLHPPKDLGKLPSFPGVPWGSTAPVPAGMTQEQGTRWDAWMAELIVLYRPLYMRVCFGRDPRASSLHMLWHYGQQKSLQFSSTCFINTGRKRRKEKTCT